MFNWDRQIILYKRIRTLLGKLLKYAFFCIFSLFYVLAPYYVPTYSVDDANWTYSSISKDQSHSTSKAAFNSYDFLLAGSNTVNFIKEDTKDDEFRLFWVHFSGFKFLESCIQLLYVSIQHLTHSRHPVPLFVLYHSWKSFLLS